MAIAITLHVIAAATPAAHAYRTLWEEIAR